MTRPPADLPADPVALVRGGRRLALAASHSEALWLLRTQRGRFPAGTTVVSLKRGVGLSRRCREGETVEPEAETQYPRGAMQAGCPDLDREGEESGN